MKIAIFSQHSGKYTNDILLELFSLKDKYGLEIFLEKKFVSILNEDLNSTNKYDIFSSYKDLDNSFKLMITIGGDGTLLRSIAFVKDLQIPIIGINTGRLGFLATLNKELLKPKLEKIIKGEYQIENRTLLEVNVKEKTDFAFALNEITVGRKIPHQ
jgi:NAD+ kinase